MDGPKVSVIIVNFNGKRFLKDCLDSVLYQTYPNYDVILVDNGSTDGSVEFVKKNYPKVELVKNEKNLGFATGNNVGIRKALSDPTVRYIALLNNDTKVDKDLLTELIKFSEKVDMVSSNVFPYDMMYKGESRDIELENTNKKGIEVLGPHGAAGLYSRKLLEDIKMDEDYFDSDFFMYAEDVDLKFRARLLGYRCLFNPRAVVYHHIGGTAGKIQDFILYHTLKNHIYVWIKDCPTSILLRYFPIILLKEIAILGYALINGELITTLKAKIDATKNLKKMLLKRKKIQGGKKVSDKEIDKWVVAFCPFINDIRKLKVRKILQTLKKI